MFQEGNGFSHEFASRGGVGGVTQTAPGVCLERSVEVGAGSAAEG